MSAVQALRARFAAGDPRALARALSWATAGDPRAEALLQGAPSPRQGAAAIGLSGPPGAGKSTLADHLVGAWRDRGLRVAVLAVDPSAPAGGGALLGDRVRLARGSGDPDVFVRSLACRGRGGGLAPGLATALALLRAFGFDRVLVETVGAGQGDVDVAAHVDTLVVVQAPGLGDDVQAAKAGLLDVADVLVVGKADLPGADRLGRELAEALAVAAAANPPGDWTPPVVRVAVGAPSARRPPDLRHDGGVGALLAAVEAHAGRAGAGPRAVVRERLATHALAREHLARALAGVPADRWAALARGDVRAETLAAEALAAAAATAATGGPAGGPPGGAPAAAGDGVRAGDGGGPDPPGDW